MRVWLLAIGVAACGPRTLPPHGEVVLVVDTDLPVPRVVSRLRIDVMTEDRALVVSRDDLRPDRRDWPVSFSVMSQDESRPRVLFVRLRAYPDGRLDLTGEPDPATAIERLVRVQLIHGYRGRARVVLRGECASCAEDAIVEPSLDIAVPTEAGSFGDEPCTGESAHVCVPGGAFLFGDRFHRVFGQTGVDPRPERIVRVRRFHVDRDEVTVARYRAALARGFAPPTAPGVREKDGPPGPAGTEACTFSASPRGREDYAISCVAWDTARAFCQFEGGDLPTEAQWEYLALAAGKKSKSRYAWGDDAPTCERAAYGRSFIVPECGATGLPPPGLADLTPQGVRDLTGGLSEHVRDTHLPFTDACWNAKVDPYCFLPPRAGCEDPKKLDCIDDPAWTHGVRGGSWFDGRDDLILVSRDHATRVGSGNQNSGVGFRCVYPAP
jgi:formylglycine-generating enzyme required for sulfatase activity